MSSGDDVSGAIDVSYQLALDVQFGYLRETEVAGPRHDNPKLVLNRDGSTVQHALIEELDRCDSFTFSVAFVSAAAIAQLKQHLIDFGGTGRLISDNGKLTGGMKQWDRRYVFATIQTLSQRHVLSSLVPDAFDYVVIDEAQRADAAGCQRVVDYLEITILAGISTLCAASRPRVLDQGLSQGQAICPMPSSSRPSCWVKSFDHLPHASSRGCFEPLPELDSDLLFSVVPRNLAHCPDRSGNTVARRGPIGGNRQRQIIVLSTRQQLALDIDPVTERDEDGGWTDRVGQRGCRRSQTDASEQVTVVDVKHWQSRSVLAQEHVTDTTGALRDAHSLLGRTLGVQQDFGSWPSGVFGLAGDDFCGCSKQ